MVFIILFVGLPLAFMVPGVGGSNRDYELASGQLPIIKVGDTAITSGEFMRMYGEVVNQRSRNGQSTEAIDMMADGTIDQILEQLVQSALIEHGANTNPVRPEKNYLSQQLRDSGMFNDASGEFQGALYNEWVQGSTKRGINWDNVYDALASDTNRSSYVELIQASAYVNEAEIREQYIRQQQKLNVKYATIEPNTDRTEEQLRAFYDENPGLFDTPPERVVEFVTFPIVAPIPAEAYTALERARAGEDWATLVEEYSVGADKEFGGDMGWMKVTDTPTPREEVIFALSDGEVSDIYPNGLEYHIFKVSETRINDEDGAMELRTNRIVFRPEMTDEEAAAMQVKADAFLAGLSNDSQDLRTAAEAQALSVTKTNSFNTMTAEIDGLAPGDSFGVRRAVSELSVGQSPETVIRGQRNLIVAEVVEVIDAQPRSFEEARDDVESEAVRAYKSTEEYLNALDGYVTDILENATSLADIATVAPELNVTIKESGEFGINDFRIDDGLFWNSQSVFALMSDKQPGEIAGPINDFQQGTHFLELIERVDLESAELEQGWEVAKINQLASARQQRSMERQLDYLQFLSEQAQHVQGLVYKDEAAIKMLLGLDQPRTVDAPVVPDETALENGSDAGADSGEGLSISEGAVDEAAEAVADTETPESE